MNRRHALMSGLVLAGSGGVALAAGSDTPSLQQQVSQIELAFAKTMADRNFEAFKAFIADEAIFFSGDKPLRGKAEVLAGWQKFYTKPTAPFSWKPESVEVLASGTLAQSTGPVFGPNGEVIARFHSIWRLEEGKNWRVVFDKGYDVCDCKKPAA